MERLTWIAVTYNSKGQPVLELFPREEKAHAHLKETAQDWLDSGENPPLLDEWFAGKITANIELRSIPYESVLTIVPEREAA